ncbi:MAG: GntR family transcriptional regulator [Acidimicrobiales bacterium]
MTATVGRHPILVTSHPDEIAFRIETEIIEGLLEPGSHLMQGDLCRRFGVSRTPVREALRKLQAQGLVELVPNKGARIRVVTVSDLEEIYAVRAELEGYAAALAAGRTSVQLTKQLVAMQRELDEVVRRLAPPSRLSEGDGHMNAQLTRLNEDFHGAIRAAAGNDLLDRTITDLQQRFPKDYVWKAITTKRQMLAVNVTEHRRILRAIQQGDREAARFAMTAHVHHAAEILLGHLRRHEATS